MNGLGVNGWNIMIFLREWTRGAA
ncbi:hypothetical protein IL54_3470 [Sphingobium sp. ba1]|nr:hypothetical protein IL54_3470 [Sphingobium sp. ba1]